ncbi:MAG: YbfB/YjiJ family MFS transporter [Pseudomonadota bacterium]
MASFEPPASQQQPWRTAVTAALALAMAMGIGRFAFTPLLPLMLQDGGLTVAQGGWLASANYGGYLLGALTAARWERRAPRPVGTALLLVAVLTLAMAPAQGLPLQAALRLGAGLASAWVLVMVSSRALALLRAAPGIWTGLVFAGVGAGIAAAGAACLGLALHGVPAPAAWAVLGAVALAVTLALWRGVELQPAVVSGAPAGLSTAAPAGAAGTGPVPRGPRPWTLVLCYGLFGFGYIVPATFLPAMAHQLVADARIYGLVWPVFGLAAALSTLAAAPLMRRSSPRAVWAGAQAVMAVGVALPVLVPGPVGIALASLAVGGTFMVATMAGIADARGLAGARAVPLVAAMTAAFAAGQIAGPLAVSALTLAGGRVEQVLLLAAAVLAASAAWLGLLARRHR